ncbi:MAG TPA: hypothetical protein VMU01_06390 [Rhizomicrobium sp.]|nr:hypothetical protein [Rhizomicrobium sp.]
MASMLLLVPSAAGAHATKWSLSVYAGPGSNDYFTHIFGGKFKVEGGVAAIALDRNVAYLGNGFKLVAEAQAVHYFFDTPTTALSLGLGLKYDALSLGPGMPVAMAFYVGPSYAIDPPLYYTTAAGVKRYTWLNYVSTEFTVGIPGSQRWAFVLRGYHRSGMYGLYAHDVDEGSMIGIGLRYRF